MKRLQRYAAKVKGSNQYWFQRHQELHALLDQKGPPTVFWTVSSADTYWPELHNLMMHPPAAQPTRVQAVINNPHITDWYFTFKLLNWIHHWLYGTLDAEWHWVRYEYQARGSTHAYGCAKLKNDPDVCSLVEKEAVGWLATNRHQDDTNVDDDVEQLIQEGEVAKTAAFEYADWLGATMNISIPDETWCVPVPHNPGDANLTVEELQAMVGSLSSEHLMKRVQRYAAKVQGSNQYWFQRHQELRALLDQTGPPTFFWTVSSADTYWPELHNLMMHPPAAQPTRVQAVINNPQSRIGILHSSS